MDPLSALSLAAAIAQFVDFGAKVASRLYEFKKSTGEVPESLRSVSDQLPLLVHSLKRTQVHQIQDQDEETSLRQVIEGCYAQVQALQKILDKTLPSKNDSALRKGKKFLSSLNKDGDLQRINSKLAEYIRTLTYFHTTALPDISKLHIQPADLGEERNRTRPGFLVKFDQDPHFIGRDDVLQEVFTHFESGQHRVAIHGMAGVGKSKIAIECCYRFYVKHPGAHVFWVHAGSLVRFEQSYKDIAQALSLINPNGPNVNVLASVKDWFNETTTPWLAIFDNADDMETLFAPTGKNDRADRETPRLSDYLPRANVGSVIVTTRDRRVADRLTNAATTIQLHTFEVSVAQAFLQSRLGSGLEKNAQEELVQALDCLPLAISQAAAFIAQNAISPTDYLELLRSSDAEMKDLLATETYDLNRDPEMRNSIIQTWILSFARIQEQNSRAVDILSLMAVLDSQSVPSYLLRKEGDSKIQFMTAIGTLKAFSLISEESHSSTYSMHRVVHLAIQSWLETRDTLSAAQREALEIVSGKVDIDLIQYVWSPSDNLLPHARLVAKYKQAEGTLSCHAHLLSALASHDSQCGDLNTAHTAAVEAVEVYRRMGDTQSFAFLESGSVLVDMLLIRDNHQEAEALSCELLSICTDLGIMSYNIARQHAVSLVHQERYNEAEELFRQLLDRANILDDCDFADLIRIYHDLASALRRDNRLSEAEDILSQGLEVEDSFPHDSIGFERNKLQETMGNVYRSQARWQEAVEIFRECSDFREGYWGRANRDTLYCRNHLSSSLVRTADFREAYDTAYVGFDLAIRNLGTSDEFLVHFSCDMMLASLMQDKMGEFSAKGESTQGILSMVEQWEDTLEDNCCPTLKTVFARDTSLQQAEFHLGKAFDTSRHIVGLEQESSQHLNKAYNDIWDTFRKHKSAQRS